MHPASASHILIKGGNGPTFLTELKGELGRAKNVPVAFADAAAKYSSCPSAKNGGSLGTFKQGAMVPAFDKVVFSEDVGKIHGPVSTPFGAHLIYIESRSE
jgi:peptidyl-prolyl cis-trans isomerase C